MMRRRSTVLIITRSRLALELASLNGSLSLTVLNSALSSYFNFAPLTGSEAGVIAQADFGISFAGGMPGVMIAFSGSQSSVNVAVNAGSPVSVPEGVSSRSVWFASE